MALQTSEETAAVADTGTTQRWQHAGRTFEHTGSAVAVRVLEENMVDILRLRELISQRQNDAALRLLYDYRRASIEPRIVARYSPTSRTHDVFAAERDRTEREEEA